jgi:hypothetical protein
MAIEKSKQQIPRDESAADDNLQMVLKTEFGPLWMEGVLQGKNERTSTAVFVEGNSLQNWAKETFGSELDGGDLRMLITPCAREPFQIHYYLEITDKRGEKAAKKLAEDGLHVHIVDRRGPWPESHSEDHICANARDILPVVKHLILVCGGVDPTFVNLLGGAKNMGCETTLVSFSAPKKNVAGSRPFGQHQNGVERFAAKTPRRTDEAYQATQSQRQAESGDSPGSSG